MYQVVRSRRLRGLRGLVGQAKPRWPYGLGGLVGQRKPVFPYGLGCACDSSRVIVAERMAALGYTGPYDSSLPVDQYPYPSQPIVVPPEIPFSPTGVPGSQYGSDILPTSGGLTPQQLATLATTPGNMLPGVTAATLLAAAALPNAPPVVVQAAAQYKAANPVTSSLSSIFSGSVGGIPTVLLLGGGALLLVVLATKKGR